MIYHLVHDNSYLIECIMALFLNFVLQLTKSSQNITESHNDNKSSVFCDPHTLFYNDRQVPKPIVLHGMSPRTPRTPCLCKSSKPGGSSRRFPKKNITDFNQFQQLHITSNKWKKQNTPKSPGRLKLPYTKVNQQKEHVNIFLSPLQPGWP